MESYRRLSSLTRNPRRCWIPKQSGKGSSFPMWVVFDNDISHKGSGSFRKDNAKTPSARARATNGDPMLVSFTLVAPPAASRLNLHYPEGARKFNETALVAAHLDSVLFRVVAPSGPITTSHPWCCHTDYFVCKAGPSGLTMIGPLPPCYIDGRQMAGQGLAVLSHMLHIRDIGLLRCGEEFAVADMKMLIPDDDSMPVEAEVFRYRSNAASKQWEIKRFPIHRGEDHGEDRVHGLRWWVTDAVVPFEGNLCWIDYHRGILFCNVFSEDPQLRYVELPVEPPAGDTTDPEFGRAHAYVTRSVSVTNRGIMKFVNIARADGEIASKRRLGSGFTMTVWSLATPLSSEKMDWVIDGTMTAEELWEQFSYVMFKPCLPRLSPEFPFLSLNEPNMVYVVLRERGYGAGRTFVLAIDIKFKALQMIYPFKEMEDIPCEKYSEMTSSNIYNDFPVLPSLFSMYLNASCSNDAVERPLIQIHDYEVC
ncbi:hypothetical protein ACP4OV_030537 [Aristida adscensionis]